MQRDSKSSERTLFAVHCAVSTHRTSISSALCSGSNSSSSTLLTPSQACRRMGRRRMKATLPIKNRYYPTPSSNLTHTQCNFMYIHYITCHRLSNPQRPQLFPSHTRHPVFPHSLLLLSSCSAAPSRPALCIACKFVPFRHYRSRIVGRIAVPIAHRCRSRVRTRARGRIRDTRSVPRYVVDHLRCIVR